MRDNRRSPVRATNDCPTGRIRQLHLIAAARVEALRPATEQQVSDIVRVTVDDEVDTRTFKAIVADLSDDTTR